MLIHTYNNLSLRCQLDSAIILEVSQCRWQKIEERADSSTKASGASLLGRQVYRYAWQIPNFNRRFTGFAEDP